jgi:hypothetical protein
MSENGESTVETVIIGNEDSDEGSTIDSKITFIIYNTKHRIDENLKILEIETIKLNAKKELIENLIEGINEIQFNELFADNESH